MIKRIINHIKQLPKFKIIETRTFGKKDGKQSAIPQYLVYRRLCLASYEYSTSFSSLEEAKAYVDAMNEILEFKNREIN